jgi:parvulin-like peptidyl-prolyl isomerase
MQTRMKKALWGLIAGWVVITGGSAAEAAATRQIVAVVDNAVLYKSDLELELRLAMLQIQQDPNETTELDAQQLREKVLDKLIDRSLLVQKANQDGIKASDSAVNARLARLKKLYPSLAAYHQKMKLQGLSEDQVRERIRQGVMIQRVLAAGPLKGLHISPQEAWNYYHDHPEEFMKPEQVHLSHLFIQVPQPAESAQVEAAREKIEAIFQRLQEGENFTALAIEYSDDPSRIKGGDIGYLTYSQLVPEVAQATFGMSPGQVSGIIQSPLGFHIIKLHDRRPAQRLDFEEVRDALIRHLKAVKADQATERYLRQLKTRASIRRHLR